MMKLKALNSEISSEEDAPVIRREAQEEIVLDLYNKALRLQYSNDNDEAESVVNKLLEENIPQLESQGGLPKTMSTIKYSCYMNLGSISMSKGLVKKALDNFLIASEHDKTNITLWYKIGMLSMKIDKFHQAAFAFSKGFDCNESHWPCLDKLITVLFAIKDTIGCLDFIGKALTLDPYYVKGIVLRKHIYKNNPFTEEYYKRYNPNYDPELKIDVEYTEEEEMGCLSEVQVISDRIKEVEKSLIPKPVMTIPLPIPLEDYTWVALGKTITGVHQYLTDNNMTHLTKINLNKCMSGSNTREDDKSNKLEEDVLIEKVSSPTLEEQVEEMIVDAAELEDVKVVEKVENIEVLERRMSTTSENDQNENNGTPVQTDDNDEMEQENEEPEENMAQKRRIGRPSKCNKRKRDLVSDLQIWGWHSKRKSTKRGKNEKDYTVEDALKRIIPSHLIPDGLVLKKYNAYEDSMNTMDLYNMHKEENSFTEKMLSPISSPKDNSENYFGTPAENDDVKKFWTRNWENCDALDLIEEYVYSVSNLWKFKWPEEMVSIFIKSYNMFREHFSHPPVTGSEKKLEDLKKDALATLLFGELITYTNKKEFLENKIHCTSVSHLILLSGWDDDWGDEIISFSGRVHWLRAHLFKKQNENNLAIMALQIVQEIIIEENSKNIKIYLPNCSKFNVISCSVIEDLLSELELIDSLNHLEELYETEKYDQVSLIIKLTFSSTTNHMTSGTIGRHAQLGLLMHSLWFTNTNDCFVWTEECFNEAIGHFVRPSVDREKWELIVDKCLLFFMEIIKNETVSVVDVLSELSQTRLIENLCSLCIRQINSNCSKIPLGTVIPWILLHYILLRDEHKQQAKKTIKHIKYDELKGKNNNSDDEEEISPSIAILFSAHEFLGPKGWCLVNNGELLHFILDTIIYRLDTPIFESTRDKMEIHLEQAFFCLYQHPSKKNKVSRHLADHNINPLPLTWARAHQLYEFFCPAYLPEFDSYKSVSISSELEQLLQRICAIVPKECDPQPLISKVNDYIHGVTDEMPEPIDFPNKPRAIYYLLADYYFKQSEIKKSYKYFVLDLCINPERVDSWAGLSLGTHSQLEYKLNHCERFKTEMEFIEKAKSARICFKEALKLNDKHLTLWIEFGSFEYMVHSFCSRVLKYESDTLSMEKFEILETEKDRYLNSASSSFEEALALYRLDQGDADERWLYHYMLAKIAEKKQEDPSVYLHHYSSAANLLHENKCTYPEKINYNNPQHLSLEALEVHYRINASILKYLEVHEGKIIPCSLGKLFKKCLDSSMIQKNKYDSKPTSNAPDEPKLKAVPTETTQNSDNTDDDVRGCLEDVLKQIEGDTSKSQPRDVQEIMDEMMKATMEKQIEICSDSDVESGLVQEVVIEPSKIDKADSDDKSDEKASIKSEDDSNIRKSTTTATEDSSSSSSSSNSSSSSDSESDDSSSSSTDSEENSNENFSDAEVLSLVDRCIVGLEQCIRRLPQNYKALYRLAHLYFSYGKKKDLNKCKQLLLGEYKCKNSVLVTGLFSDRKTINFFNGIWRIPSSEIDRPGSLSAHMGRCVSLLLQVLRDTHDHKTLLELCLQLRRIPDADKVYIRHSEREQLSEQALTMCMQSIRTQIKNINTLPSSSVEKLLVDIFKAYQRSQKNLVHQEKIFSALLIEAYKKWMGDKIPENANVFDLATKFCQQCRMAEKLKKQQQALLTPKATIISPPPPVMPAPGNVINPISLPMKRPGSGRPRGRPPGPKQLNQTRSPRGKSPVAGYHPQAWQNAFAAATSYNYMKQYQDELLRQYNQTLAMNHLSTLGKNMFSNTNLLSAPNSTSPLLSTASGLINTSPLMTSSTSSKSNQNTTVTSSSANQKLLNQSQSLPFKATNVSTQNSSLLNSATLMQQMNTLAANQLSQSLSQLSPGLLKELSKQLTVQANNQMLSDNIRQYAAMGQAMSKPSKQYTNKVKPVKSNKSAPETSTGFKYPSADIIKTKPNKPTFYKDLSKPADPTVDLMKGRPNISITPVTQTTNTITNVSTGSSSPGKTLQEKLADKQKQQKSSVAKSLEFSTHTKFPVYNKSTYKSLGSGMPTLPKALDVIPNYLLDSGLSISQVSAQSGVNILPLTNKETSMKSSVSKISAPKKVDKNLDDVIIIE